MVPDHDTNAVFISGLLPERHPAVTRALEVVLGNRLRTIPGTKDVWCRDYMPIQSAPDRFIQFRYDPDYLKDYPHLRTEDAASLLDLTTRCSRSDLVIDGGNVVRWNETAILTDKVCKENSGVSHSELQRDIRRLLEVDRVVVIPTEPGDWIAHSDGVVRFVDRETVLVNDYARINRSYGGRLAKVLARHGLKPIPFPYSPTDQQGPDPDIPPAIGVYINFLQIAGTIFCPTFGLHEDDDALKTLKKCFPKERIVPVACNDLAMGGGVLNCATWNIRMNCL